MRKHVSHSQWFGGKLLVYCIKNFHQKFSYHQINGLNVFTRIFIGNIKKI